MKTKKNLVEVDRSVYHTLLRALILVQLKGKKIEARTPAHGDAIELPRGVIIVEKKEKPARQ